MIPFPVFDGGHIVMAIGETIRRKSVLPLQILEKVQMACVILLLCFFCYVTWFDTADLFGHGRERRTKSLLSKSRTSSIPAK